MIPRDKDKIKNNSAPYKNMVNTNFQQQKESFLEKLKSHSGKQSFKRYTGTTLRYAGGKTLAVGLIVDLLPNNINRIISPFFGGGSFEIACAKELGLQVIGFDIFDLLVNYWKYQFSNPEEMYQYLVRYKPTKEGFLEVKNILKEQWNKKEGKLFPNREIKNEAELAALYYFNHNTSYGPT